MREKLNIINSEIRIPPPVPTPPRCFECGSEIGDVPPDAGVFGIGLFVGVFIGAALLAVGFWLIGV